MRSSMRSSKALIVFILGVCLFATATATSTSIQTEPEIYWRYLNTISSGDVVTGQIEKTIMPNFRLVGEMIVVEELDSIFWCTCNSGALYRVDMDGSNFQEMFIFDLRFSEVGPIYDFDIDPIARKVYWSEGYRVGDNFQSATRIKRSDFDGANVEILIDEIQTGMDIALDVQNAKIYWATISPTQISRSNLDGTAIEVVHEQSIGGPIYDLELDIENQTIYWRNSSIFRVNFDGSDPEPFASPVIANQVEFPCRCEIDAFSIDRERGVIYWVESRTGTSTRSLYMKELADNAEPTLIYQSEDLFREFASLEGSDTLFTLGDQRINSFDLESLQIDPVLFGTAYADVFAVNPETSKAYEIENSLYEIDLETAEVTLLKFVDSFSNDVVFVEAENSIYWSEASNVIRKISLDTLQVQTVLEDEISQVHIFNLAIDSEAGQIYWLASGHIGRAGLDGVSQENIVDATENDSGSQLGNYSLVLDPAGEKIYWTERNSTILKRADLDGSHVETIFDGVKILSMAIDVFGRKLYFSRFIDNFTPSRIQRSDLDGSNIEDVFQNSSAFDMVIVQK